MDAYTAQSNLQDYGFGAFGNSLGVVVFAVFVIIMGVAIARALRQ